MLSYLIYQRPMDDSLMKLLVNGHSNPVANAYLALTTMRGDTPEDTVRNALMYTLYHPTMFMQFPFNGSDEEALEAIFDEGNGYGDGTITTTNLMKHSSMSVGDIVVNLTENHAYVCMPTGWHLLKDTELKLNLS